MPFFTLQRFITTTFPSRQPAKHRPAWRILVPIFMIQRCLHFVDTFEALIYYIRWYKLKKGGPTLSVDSPNIDQHKKSALLCSKALSGAPSGDENSSGPPPVRRAKTPQWGVFRARESPRWCTRKSRNECCGFFVAPFPSGRTRTSRKRSCSSRGDWSLKMVAGL